MADLVVITHEYDVFAHRLPHQPGRFESPYLLSDVLRHLIALGHTSRVIRGPRPVCGDVALLHVDSTIVNDDYLSLRAHYPKTINFGTANISKRKISRLLLTNGDTWNGPVIVKTDLNNSGFIEDLHNRRAANRRRPLPHPGIVKGDEYRVFECIADVNDSIWEDPSLVVERFLPEPDASGGYVLRTWVFMGPRERCTRMVTPTSISKAGAVTRYEPIDVPPALRIERERLKFDFGKFDFVMHKGEPILFDANRTPGVATAIQSLMNEGARNLAEGLDALIRGNGAAPARADGPVGNGAQ